jgi:hypothetical protein
MILTCILDTQSSQPKRPTKALKIAAAKNRNAKKADNDKRRIS